MSQKYLWLIGGLLAVAPVVSSGEDATTGGAKSQPPKSTAKSTRANKTIEFRSLAEALAKGKTEKRVVIAYFTAKWCGYCRKLETQTYRDPKVRTLADEFVWAKVDIDAEPLVALRFGIRAVPRLILFNVRDEVLTQAAYLSPSEMVSLLRENVGRAEAAGAIDRRQDERTVVFDRLRQAAPGSELDKAVAEVVTLLAAPERDSRKEALKHLRDLGPKSLPGLVAGLSDRRLAIRAASYDLLVATARTRKRPSFDAFADAPSRTKQAAAWEAWLAAKRK